MNAETFVDNVRISPSGQVTIPQTIQKVLGISGGSRLAFIVEGNEVRIVNPLAYALDKIQTAMEGEAERAGLYTEDDVVALVKEIRAERAQL